MCIPFMVLVGDSVSPGGIVLGNSKIALALPTSACCRDIL